MDGRVAFLLYVPASDHLFCRLVLYIPFDIVGQVAEEVDAGLLLEFLDADDVGSEGSAEIPLMPEPESDGLVLPVALSSDLVFHQGGREEVSRYYEIVSDMGELSLPVDRTAAADEEGVLQTAGEGDIGSHLSFHCFPDACVEVVDLGLHIAEIEGLVVGFPAVDPVLRRTEVSVVVAGAPVRIVGEEGTGREERIHRVEVGTLLVLSFHGLSCVAGIYLVAGPAVRLLLCIPFYAVVHLTVVQSVGEDDATPAPQFRKFQPVCRRLRVFEVGVGIIGNLLFSSFVRGAAFVLAARSKGCKSK